jgi:hypothetical protein
MTLLKYLDDYILERWMMILHHCTTSHNKQFKVKRKQLTKQMITYFDIETKKQLREFILQGFDNYKNNSPPFYDENNKQWNQIGGISLPQGNLWCFFYDGHEEYATRWFDKCSDRNQILSTGKSLEEMIANTVNNIAKVWNL